MVVLFLVPVDQGVSWHVMANQPHQKVRSMPCVVHECHEPHEVVEHLDKADVFLYSGTSFIHRQATMFPKIPNKILTVDFDGDPWRDINWYFVSRCNIIITSVITPFWHFRKGNIEIPAFWSPGCCDVSYLEEERDIDVLFWGQLEEYPFRMRIMDLLMAYRNEDHAGETNELGCLFHIPLNINGRIVKFARLNGKLAHNNQIWGEKLYEIIRRAKVCITGSHVHRMSLGRYFENAAHGAVTISNDFYDSEALGFKHGENIWLTTDDKFIPNVLLLLNDDGLRTKLQVNARRLMAERHTVSIRANELHNFLYSSLLQHRVKCKAALSERSIKI